MSLLLIVLLLDESHLELISELIEDVLKEFNLNDEDWRKLGRELGVYIKGQKYSYPDNSSILKKCLREWLSSGRSRGSVATSSFFWFGSAGLSPTLDELAAALKRIGYSEAGEYIIKTCKLIIMFNDQCY